MQKSSFYIFMLLMVCLLGFSTSAQAQVSQTTDGQKRFFVFNTCMQYKKNEQICLCEAKTIQKNFTQTEWEQYYRLNSVQNKSDSGLTQMQIEAINSKVKKITSECWGQKNRARCKRRCPYNGKCLEYY